MPKKPSVSARRSQRTKIKIPTEPVHVESDHSENSMTNMQTPLHDKKAGKRPITSEETDCIKRSKKEFSLADLDETLDFWDSTHCLKLNTIKEKPLAHGRIVDLDTMESLNCEVKSLFLAQNWSGFFSTDSIDVPEDLVRLFYANLRPCKNEGFETMVLNTRIVITKTILSRILDCQFSGYCEFFKNMWPSDFEVSFDQAKACICEKPDAIPDGQLGPLDLSFEVRVLAHIVCTTILPRTGSFSTLSQRDTLIVYCLITKKKLDLGAWIIGYMLESISDCTSLPYGLIITRILQFYRIDISAWKKCPVSACYNARAFASMGYVKTEGNWVRKDSKFPKMCPPDIAGPSIQIPPTLPSKLQDDLGEFKDLLLSLHCKGDHLSETVDELKLDVGRTLLKLNTALPESAAAVRKLHRRIDALSTDVQA